MGNQQLLLLVLGTIIAGLAVAAGASAFEAKRQKAAMELDQVALMDLAAKAQTWKMKPRVLGGGDHTPKQNFADMSVADLGVSSAEHLFAGLGEAGGETSVDKDVVQTQDGTCYHVRKNEEGLTISTLKESCEKSDWSSSIFVKGTTPADITWLSRDDITTMAGGSLGLASSGTLGSVDSTSTGYNIGSIDEEGNGGNGGGLPESCDEELELRDQPLDCLQELIEDSI